MAKYKVKKGNKKGLVKAICALVLCIVLLAGGVVVGYGWGTHWTYKKSGVQATQPDNGGSTITDGDEDNGIQVTSRKLERTEYAANGISETADSAFEINVYVDPEIATNKQVDCSVTWLDEESDWADGKDINDYYSVTPTAAGSLTFNAVCKQPFGEPVIITFTSRDNKNIKKTVRADYVAKLLDFSVYCPVFYASVGEDCGYYIADWTEGTITCGDSFKITRLFCSIDDDFISTFDTLKQLTKNKDVPEFYIIEGSGLEIDYDAKWFLPDEDPASGDDNFMTKWEDFIILEGNYTFEQKKTLQNYVYYLVLEKYGKTFIDGAVRWYISYSYTIDGKTTEVENFEYVGRISTMDIPNIAVTSISTNKDELKH